MKRIFPGMAALSLFLAASLAFAADEEVRAQELFSSLAATDQFIPFSNTQRGCEARAHLYAFFLDRRHGVVADKIFVRSRDALGFEVEAPAGSGHLVKWGYHVAVVVNGMALDPAVFKGPVPVQSWVEYFGRGTPLSPLVYRSSRFPYMIADITDNGDRWKPEDLARAWKEIRGLRQARGTVAPDSTDCFSEINALITRADLMLPEALGIAWWFGGALQTWQGSSLNSRQVTALNAALRDPAHFEALQRSCPAFRETDRGLCTEQDSFWQGLSRSRMDVKKYVTAFATDDSKVIFMGEEHSHQSGQRFIGNFLKWISEEAKSHATRSTPLCLAIEASSAIQPVLDRFGNFEVDFAELIRLIRPINGEPGVHPEMIEAARALGVPVYAIDLPRDRGAIERLQAQGRAIDRDVHMTENLQRLSTLCVKTVVHVGYWHLLGPRATARSVCKEIRCRKLLMANENNEFLRRPVCEGSPQAGLVALGLSAFPVQPLSEPVIMGHEDGWYFHFQDLDGILFIP